MGERDAFFKFWYQSGVAQNMNQIVEWQFVRNRLASKTGKIFALRETFQLSTFNGGSSNQNNNNNNTNTNNDDDGKPIWFASPTILVCLVRARIIASRQAIITSRIVKRKRVRFGSNQSVHSSEINFLSLSLSLRFSFSALFLLFARRRPLLRSRSRLLALNETDSKTHTI